VTISDPWRTVRYEDRGTFILMRGPETVYNADRCLREWDTQAEAREWAEKNLEGRFAWRLDDEARDDTPSVPRDDGRRRTGVARTVPKKASEATKQIHQLALRMGGQRDDDDGSDRGRNAD